MQAQKTIQTACFALAIGAASTGMAQTKPDAGQTLQQLQPQLPLPRQNQPLIITEPTGINAVAPGGPTVTVASLRFQGNTVLSTGALDAALADALGKSFDLAGLRGLAERVSALYRANGYPFARAVLPPQGLQAGALLIEVAEGRYGKVTTPGSEDRLSRLATSFLNNLKPGAVIESTTLERATLILADQPGIKISPVIRPGTDVGTGDLEVRVSQDQRYSGDLGLDNYGSRYSGQTRARASVNINSPFTLGDQISIRSLASDANLLLGSVAYSVPVGADGLRANVGYSYTRYLLVREFAVLGANGRSSVVSAGLSYPFIRSQKTNLSLSAQYQNKDLKDNKDSTNTREAKTSDSIALAMLFDRRDNLGGGGITYGSFNWTSGRLNLDAALTAADANNTRGSFNKFNLEVVRLQSLAAGFSAMVRLNMQATNKNLDSSEKFSLGGATGVRAYPTGEANGDAGALAQLELRYAMAAYPDFAPYLFVDAGTIKTNARPPAGALNNTRSISGAGLGLRYQTGNWNADASLAWRQSGGPPQSDLTNDRKPRMLISVGFKF